MKRRELLAVLCPLAAVLLAWPLLTVASRPTTSGGVPPLVLYLFGVWAALVAVLAWAARRPGSEEEP